MNNKKTITVLSVLIALFAGMASYVGITSTQGRGMFEFQSIYGQAVSVYGKGIYQYMSVPAAVSQIAQDKVTLFLGIPLFLISLYLFRKNSLKGKILLSGTLIYFFTTYMFNMASTIFNSLFLVYVAITGLSFFALILTLMSFERNKMNSYFSDKLPVKFIGGFLMFGAIATAGSWLGIVMPAVTGGKYPLELGHYTTMVVQAFDLSIYLPISFLSGFFIFRKKQIGYLMAPVYLIFLVILMASVTAKVFSVNASGIAVNPQQLFIFPIFTLISVICSYLVFKNIKSEKR